MDHFGPAWTGFPALDRYDSVDLFFVLTALAFHRNTTAAKQAKKLRMRTSRRVADADELACDADCSEGFQTDATRDDADDAAATPTGLTRVMSRVKSWGCFA